MARVVQTKLPYSEKYSPENFRIPMLLKKLCTSLESDAQIIEAALRHLGITDPNEQKEFLSGSGAIEPPTRKQSPSFHKLADVLEIALLEEAEIAILADYDCDGVTSAAIMTMALEKLGGRPEVHFPDRFSDGYGATRSAVAKACLSGVPDFLLCLDCGTSSIEELSIPKKLGCVPMAVDHHNPGPKGHIPHPLINPKAFPEEEASDSLSSLCTAGLCYLLALELSSRLGDAIPQTHALALAAVGTVADVMELRGINRRIVKQGLQLINKTECPGGLNQLLKAFQPSSVDEGTIGFSIGPCLNAPGRLANARVSFDLLTSTQPEVQMEKARECFSANLRRKELTAACAQEAKTQIAKLEPGRRSAVVFSEDWHQGVVGIAAGRLKEEYNLAVFSLAPDAKGWKGSGRAPQGISIGDLAAQAVELGLAIAGGGHDAAAGITIAGDKLDAFAQWLECQCSNIQSSSIKEIVALAPLDSRPPRKWITLLSKLRPFGAGNPEPTLYLERARLRQPPLPLRKRSDGSVWALKGSFEGQNGNACDLTAVEHQKASAEWRTQVPLDIAVRVSESSTGGRTYLNVNAVDWSENTTAA